MPALTAKMSLPNSYVLAHMTGLNPEGLFTGVGALKDKGLNRAVQAASGGEY